MIQLMYLEGGNDIETLLNPTETTSTPQNIHQNIIEDDQNTSPYFRDPIHVAEIKSALKRVKLNKATGMDEIPMDPKLSFKH